MDSVGFYLLMSNFVNEESLVTWLESLRRGIGYKVPMLCFIYKGVPVQGSRASMFRALVARTVPAGGDFVAQPSNPTPRKEETSDEVDVEVEQEEDCGDVVGETFTDYFVTVTNPNRDTFTHYDSSLQLDYSDDTVGFVFIPAGRIYARRSQRMSAKFEVERFLVPEKRRVTATRPPKLSIGPPHPDPVVETASLSAVQPPEPIYNLLIRDDLERSKALSCLQIETIVYASQKHLQHLADGTRAGFFVGDGAGVGKGRTIAGLLLENWQHGRRKALWISIGSDLKFDAERDLEDVGAKFIKVNALYNLAYRKLDSKTVGITKGVIFLTYSTLIASNQKGRSRLNQLIEWCGNDYDGLIVFDECHKAKNLVPEAGGHPTRMGQAVLDIQARLPDARIVYCSATGASEPRNMGYMTRLGLWGRGTSFMNLSNFLGSLEKGGVGALEIVAMDLKARGMYLCRTLSFKGAEFNVVEVPLEDDMMDMYEKAAEFWIDLRKKLLYELALYTEKPESGPLWCVYWAYHQRFFRNMCVSAKVPAVVKLCHQALTEDKCVVIGLQSTGEARTEEAVAEYGTELEDFVSGTRELLLKFVKENFPLPEKPESLSGEDGVEVLQRKKRSATTGVSFKGRARKAVKYQEESDTESETDSEPESTESDDEFQICEICKDELGRGKSLQCSSCKQLMHHACLDPPVTGPVSADWSCLSCSEKTEECIQQISVYLVQKVERYKKATERKSQILDKIHNLKLPYCPLDDIINQLGGPAKVAEITVRRRRLIKESSAESVKYVTRNPEGVRMEMANMHEKQSFMIGKKLVAIISEAGSAGVSLQADRRAKNQRRRVHLTLELPWSADRAIQQFGRTHRSNQASAPEYRLLFSNLAGERRFASIVAKRLESLGALSQGDRRAGSSLSAYNYDSLYGKRALAEFYSRILGQSSPEGTDTVEDLVVEGKAALESVGIVRDKSYINEEDKNDVRKFLNRLLGLQPEIQNRLFELFLSILDRRVQDAQLEGHFDSGIADMKGNAIALKGVPKKVHIDHLSGASTFLFTLTIDRGFTWKAASTLLDEKRKDVSANCSTGFYESKREWLGRRHYLLAFEGPSGMCKIVRPSTGEAISHKARTCWEKEYNVSSEQCMHGHRCKLGDNCTTGRRLQEVNVLSGLILPVWGTIEKTLTKQIRARDQRLRIVRLETTTDNRRIVGLLIPNAAVNSILRDLAWVQDIDG
ncbi:hypothetical protein AgCh_009688 [Apium graveolens]